MAGVGVICIYLGPRVVRLPAQCQLAHPVAVCARKDVFVHSMGVCGKGVRLYFDTMD